MWIWYEKILEATGENFFPKEFETNEEYQEDMEMMKELKKVAL